MKKHLHCHNWFLTVIIMLGCISLFSQSNNVSGLWVGYNTQEADASYSSKYDFEIYLNQKGDFIFGRSYATVGKIYAEMELVGELKDGKYLHFQEVKVVDFKAEDGMEWCIKKGVLTLFQVDGKWHFKGNWQGTTSFSSCIPGKVFLNKVEPRA